MRHLKSGRKLGRNSTERRAMFRNMVTSLILEGRITTTDAKAKELRRYADRMITLGKRQTLAARRRAARFVRTDAALTRLFTDLAPLFAERAGGYTRIIKIAQRRGDAAPLAMVELTEQIAPRSKLRRRGRKRKRERAKPRPRKRPPRNRPSARRRLPRRRKSRRAHFGPTSARVSGPQ
jgi:large subunit ribosomal protein L17